LMWERSNMAAITDAASVGMPVKHPPDALADWLTCLR